MESRPVLIFDANLRVTAASVTCAPLLGVDETILVGLQCGEALGCPSCIGDACPLRRGLEGEGAEGFLTRGVNSGGPLAVSSSPMLAGASRLVLLHLRGPEPGEPVLSAGLQAVLDGLREMFQSDMAALAFYDETLREIRWQMTSGSVSPAVANIRLRPGEGFAGRIVLTELPLRTFRFPADLTRDPDSYPIFLSEGLHAAMGVPIGQDPVVGVLMVASRREREYSDADLERLKKAAGSITLATEMMVLYGDALRTERAKLAQEVHDGLSQNLFGLKLLLYDAQQGLRVGSPEVLEHRLADICRLLDSTLTEVRRLITDLRGSVQLHVGLISALSDYLGHFHRLSSLQVELAVRLAPGEEVSCVHAHEVLRITTEALMNVHRHAGATRVRVEVTREQAEYRLTISDDGCGFDPAVQAPGGHFGLAIMRERAQRIGGRLEIQSEPGRGTVTILHIPI